MTILSYCEQHNYCNVTEYNDCTLMLYNVQKSLEWQEVDRKLLTMTDDVDYDVECKQM